MARKRREDKPHGHCCRVCGMHKANEKFSGKGHAAHICRQCAGLSAAERSEMLVLRRIEGMMGRYLNKSEIQWLRGKMQDKRPVVSQAARELHAVRFPHYEQNLAKKRLVMHSLEFFIHGNVLDEWDKERPVHMRFCLDESGTIRRLDYDMPEGDIEREQTVDLGAQAASRLLTQIVHELNAPFWAESFSDSPDIEDEFDEYFVNQEDPVTPDSEPLWSLRMILNKGEGRILTFQHQMHEEPQALFWVLMELFEPETMADHFIAED